MNDANDQKNLNPAESPAEEEPNTGIYEDIEVVIGDQTIMTRQPDPNRKSAHRRHWERHRRRVRMMIIAASVFSALAILFSLMWYWYSPLIGYGDLSENISSDMISKARSKFVIEQYSDKKEGVVLSYNIYVPEDYDRTKHYPLVFSIADTASTGDNIKKPLSHNFGGAVWATDEEQAKHPCFVVVPCYPEEVTGQGRGTFTRYTDISVRMIDSIVKKYNINTREVYGVGQGMGASMLIFMAAEDPDRFSSMLLVDGGVEIDDMCDLSRSRFVYFAAGGDSESLEGQRKVMDALDSAGCTYAELDDIDAEAPIDELNDAASAMLDRGCDQNFITWRKGSVGFSLFYGEQRVSYRFGYKIDTVRDWLFEDQDLLLDV